VSKSTAAQIEDLLFDNYQKFFQKSEEKRRWSIWKDVPWEQANHEASDVTAEIVQFFSAVEMYLPDYTAKMMQLIRESRGRAWFHVNWGFEESKHSLVLEEWLLRSGKRTEEQVQDFAQSLLDGKGWELPFDHPRQMMIYTMIQELATGLNYVNLRRRAQSENDGALAGLLRWVAADESAHYNFYRSGVKAYLRLEPAETVADIRFVFEQFAMPGQTLIPGWEQCSRAIDKAGVYGPRQYLQKVRRPIIDDLGLTREQMKATGLPEDEADTLADRAEEARLAKETAVLGRTFSLPASVSPLRPPHRANIIRLR
jgi:acyl-[acyl-carrier-protein] desaturase